jgi:hypothetical protein
MSRAVSVEWADQKKVREDLLLNIADARRRLSEARLSGLSPRDLWWEEQIIKGELQSSHRLLRISELLDPTVDPCPN